MDVSPHAAPQWVDALPSRTFSSDDERHAKLWSSLSEVCRMLGLPPVCRDGDVMFQHVKFKPAQRVYTAGQSFESLYIVYSGFLKSVLLDESGHEQVLGFPMKCDMLGTDGIDSKFYQSELVAQSTAEVIVIPFRTLVDLSKKNLDLELEFLAVMSREVIRQQHLLFNLCSLQAEARVARFLYALSQRFAGIGYSSTQFTLRMTRQEIGSYLGLALETVSRVLGAFQEEGLISVERKEITLFQPEALRALKRLPVRRRFSSYG